MATNDSDEPRGRREDDERDEHEAQPTNDTADTAREQAGVANDDNGLDTVAEASKESFPASDAPSWMIHRL